VTAPAPGGRAASAPLLGRGEEPTIFEISAPGRRAWSLRATGLPEWEAAELVPPEHLQDSPTPVAEVSERDLVAHFTRLSHRQYAVDLGAYPLGSCTMKYNPKLCDDAAALRGLTDVHPAALEFIPQVDVQVNLAAARRYGLTLTVVVAVAPRKVADIVVLPAPVAETSPEASTEAMLGS